METTLGALLARRGLDLRHVAGPLDPQRRVRWVAVSELPDPTPYLEGGELLLTTGMRMEGDQSHYVARHPHAGGQQQLPALDRKSTRLNSSH